MECWCGNPSVIFLEYAKKPLCRKHFLKMFDKRFKATIRKHGMLDKNDLVVVGLSGGKDSCALLHSLVKLKSNMPIRIIAATIDEGIGNYREKTIETAKEECRKLGVEHVVISFRQKIGKNLDSMIKKGDRPCSICGIIRRHILNRTARDIGAQKLAIGHNLDDTAQTIMMNIMRNEPSRLARLNTPLIKTSEFVQRIKPLMTAPEKEVILYARLQGIPINEKNCPYSSIAFRKHIREMLDSTEKKYPDVKFKILNSFLETEEALRIKYGKKAKLSKCERCGEPCSRKICKYCQIVHPR